MCKMKQPKCIKTFIVRVRFYNSLPAFISLSVCTQIHHLVYKAYFEVSHLVLIMVHGKGRPRFITSAKILVSWYKTRLYFINCSQKSEQQC